MDQAFGGDPHSPQRGNRLKHAEATHRPHAYPCRKRHALSRRIVERAPPSGSPIARSASDAAETQRRPIQKIGASLERPDGRAGMSSRGGGKTARNPGLFPAAPRPRGPGNGFSPEAGNKALRRRGGWRISNFRSRGWPTPMVPRRFPVTRFISGSRFASTRHARIDEMTASRPELQSPPVPSEMHVAIAPAAMTTTPRPERDDFARLGELDM